jgi:hypothetical protein
MKQFTRNEIANMPAGREMDALIAECVTKITTCPYHGDFVADTIPHYSTDWGAAGLLAENVSKITDRFELIKRGNSSPTTYLCYLDWNVPVAQAETGPLAISRAALVAGRDGAK